MSFQTPSSPTSVSTHKTTPEPETYDGDDVWASSSPDESNIPGHTLREADMMSDLPAVRRQHMTDGYREGLSLGKAKVMQQGFDQGYPVGIAIALRAGNVLGVLEGMVAAKGVDAELRVEVRKAYEQAKKDLAMSDLLKGIDDEKVMDDKELLKNLDALHKSTTAGLSVSQAPPYTTIPTDAILRLAVMVKSRGIQINIVTQIDAKRLAEYRVCGGFNDQDNVAVCYVPIIPGAHIWFEYSIDGPHPPGAGYFSKLLMNGQIVTNWDCTSKHDYHGKAAYALRNVIRGKQRAVTQSVFMFSLQSEDRSAVQTVDGLFEIRVYRIEHRARVWNPELDRCTERDIGSRIKIVDNGLIEQQRPAKMYKYQLLDPRDKPYATVKFYCRSMQWLVEHHAILLDQPSPAPSAMISEYYSPAKSARSKHSTTTPTKVNDDAKDDATGNTQGHEHSNRATVSPVYRHCRNPSTDSLSTIAKDSLENLLAALHSDASAVRPCSPGTNEQDISVSQYSGDLPQHSSPPSPLPLMPHSPRKPHQHHKRHNITHPTSITFSPTGTANSSSTLLPALILPPLDLDLIAHRARSDIQDWRRQRDGATTFCPTLIDPEEHPKPASAQSQSSPALTNPTATSRVTSHSALTPLLRPLSPFTSAGLLRHLTRSPNDKSLSSRPPTPMILPTLAHDNQYTQSSTPSVDTDPIPSPPSSFSILRPSLAQTTTSRQTNSSPDPHLISTPTKRDQPSTEKYLHVHEREQRGTRTLRSLLSRRS